MNILNTNMFLSLCLIAKDENSYLKEWLDYHILLGVQHFWIYDNDSKVPISETLRDYIDSGWVTVNFIKGRAMQLYAYDHCIQVYGANSKWIGFIDTDEFIVLRESLDLKEFLVPFGHYGGLAISSLFFGHGNNKTRPTCGQIAGYQYRTDKRFSFNHLVKMIIQPEKVIFPVSPHSFLFKDNFFCVNEKEMRVDAQRFPCHIDTIQLNHYFTRSKEEWNNKISRGRGDSEVRYSDEPGSLVNGYATIKDTLILERLQEIISKPTRDVKVWQKITNPTSTRLINLLHQSAKQITPYPVQNLYSDEIISRPELVKYNEERAMGMSLFEEGKIVEAQKFFAEQISKYPLDVMRYTNFASACIHLKDFENAWKALAQAWRIAPKSLYVLLCMMDYFYAVGDFAQGEKTSLLAASMGDLEPVGIAILALCQWKQGKIEEAKITAHPLLPQLTENESQKPIFRELVKLIPRID